jgi:hypothetical protein
LQNLKEITLSTHTGGCEYLLPYLPENGARKELDVLVDSVRPPSAEVCRTAASFP